MSASNFPVLTFDEINFCNSSIKLLYNEIANSVFAALMKLGLLPLFALNLEGYKKIIELSSKSYLDNDDASDPHLDINNLLELKTDGISTFSGTIFGLFGKLFNKGKFLELKDIYKKINKT